MSAWPSAVVFDLDGTLIDSLPDIEASANRMLADFDLGPLTCDVIRGFVGKGSRHLCDQVLRRHGREPSRQDVDRALERFLAHYDAAPVAHGRVYPGVFPLLRTLTGSGRRLAVCTNKQKATTLSVLQGFGLASFFDVVVGGDDLAHRKPDPRHLTFVLDRLGVGASAAVMVGDSENDVRAARAAHVPVIAVSFGYCNVPFETLGPDAVIDSLADTLAAIERLCRR